MLFGIIGAGGFIAPRHVEVIHELGHVLDCAMDIHDSVRYLDQYGLGCEFFTDLEDLHQYLETCKDQGKFLDYMVICSPNYLHFEHIEFALSHGINVICEKPLVLDPGELSEIQDLEKKYNKKVFNILQLRFHPNIISLKENVRAEIDKHPDRIYEISLTYLILRGKWYLNSWKGDELKSGGLASNIGVHFFDILLDIFGDVVDSIVHVHQNDCVGGFLTLQHARISWFLSINPEHLGAQRENSYRSLVLEGEEIDFSDGFDDLHIDNYKAILNGEGVGVETARKAVELVNAIRCSAIGNLDEHAHPLCLRCGG
ncbi:Gfo/Idh/MocA family protein [Helicobacter felis]|uniref:Lipopolysaccharide biosynthesis protein n=1 Tax=Helicobacter felis (strain ATCC 49179 / CCUG 28539 / NCTC 12436 / CS1) TaxID=936155 RepID=E7A9C3_HELFC|nr:Gfo/Idh/MocA family oxidoreductase [Helicobacter felis]CBY82501.1 Lipopolysaccharide biosynthesis protein [Helicobacter felis ATCC 49179]